MTPRMGRSLGSFQNIFSRQIMGIHPKQQVNDIWDYPPLETVMEEAGFYKCIMCPEEVEYGRTVYQNAANYGPLRGDSAEVWGLG